MASEAQRARRLRQQADLLIDHAACLHYKADIMTAHNTVAVLQILKMSPDDKKLVEEYRKTDDDVRDIFDNVNKYWKTFDIVVNQFPDLKDPRFSLPSDSQMRSPKKKKPAKQKPKAPTKKGKEKAVEPVEEEEEDFEEEEGQEEEPEMEDEVEGTQELKRSASPAATEHIPSEDEGDNGEDMDNTYYPPKSQSEEEEIPILGFEEESVEREDAVDEGTMQSVVDVILARNTEEEGETAEPYTTGSRTLMVLARTPSGWLLPINSEDEIPLKRYPSDSHLQVQLQPIWASTPGLLRRKSFNGWGSPQAYPGSWDSPVFEQNVVDVSPLNYLRALGCYSDVREEVASTLQEGVLAEPIVSVAKLDQFDSDEEDQSDTDMPPLQTPSDSGSDSGVKLVY
ncbi:hypothetical protein K435DRAFT_808520 [Dendrothele bispora CBS 962.96]|uniref:Uncharacterized protein n=1 Tax=Dendrothele bispora (strain CBS 962.96) TaxID=1314807 RepID=A0A4S8L1A3_DENBC|nr:hypothetical protein K435DRAFT_808520 [Dendrothele bispora CBS 962.96]